MLSAFDILDQKKYLTLNDLKKSVLWDELLFYFNIGCNNPRQILYHFKTKQVEIPKCLCNNKLEWNQDLRQYRTYCSKKCSAKCTIDLKKQNNLTKFGVEWHSQLPDWQDKVKKTSLRKFGVEHYSQTQEFLQQTITTNQKNYGEDFAAKNIQIKEKTQLTVLKKYGVKNPAQCEEVKEKIKKTNLEKYGVENPLSSKDIQNKIKDTNLEKYGQTFAMQNSDISTKAVLTRQQNYYDPDSYNKLLDIDWLKAQHEQFTISEIAQQIKVSPSNLAKHFHKHNLTIKYHSITALERKFIEYFDSNNISYILKDRSILAPKEIDLYLPDFKFGIEINGAYWHSEEFNKQKLDHLNKQDMAKQKNITLWQFWDWEVEQNWSLILSKIEYFCKRSKKLGARSFHVKLVPNDEKIKFLIENHIQGNCSSKINLGLYNDQGQLYMISTFGQSRFSKKYKWELLRLCSLKKYSIAGGASKLINHFVKHYMQTNESLISYAQKRFSDGHLYPQLGFIQLPDSPPNYVYVKAGKLCGSRNQWQKHMLRNKLHYYDHGLSEKDNMKLNGYYRLWDCGNSCWLLTKYDV